MKPQHRVLTLPILGAALACGVAVLAAADDDARADAQALVTLAAAGDAVPDGGDVFEPDAFEPDDDRADANRIGLPRPPGPRADLPGRVPFELQAHSIFPPGDQDWVKLDLARDSLVRIRTACGFPTIFNGDTACANPPEFDTIVTLWYATPWSTTGLCNNTGDASFPPGSITTRADNACDVDADCDFNGNGVVYPDDPDDLINPVPGLPACLPWALFPPGQRPIDPADNPLVIQDDANALGGDLGSDVTVCLPRTRPGSPSPSVQADPAQRFNWYLRVNGWSDSGVPADSELAFDYETYVENLEACRFEREPNDAFTDLAGFGAGDDDDDDDDGDGDGDDDDDDDDDDHDLDAARPSVHGIYDLSARSPAPDVDLFTLDVPEAGTYVIETAGYDPIAVDTFIELWIGPDANGEFLFTGFANDDVSLSDRRSRLEVPLVPPCEALGLDCAAPRRGRSGQTPPRYVVRVTSAFVVPNFPYELRAYRVEPTPPPEPVCKSGTVPGERARVAGAAADCSP